MRARFAALRDSYQQQLDALHTQVIEMDSRNERRPPPQLPPQPFSCEDVHVLTRGSRSNESVLVLTRFDGHRRNSVVFDDRQRIWSVFQWKYISVTSGTRCVQILFDALVSETLSLQDTQQGLLSSSS